EHLATVDAAVTRDHAVAGDALVLHAEVGAAVRHHAVELDERARVHQQVDALARGELAGVVLLLDALLAATEQRARVRLVEACDARIRKICHAPSVTTSIRARDPAS